MNKARHGSRTDPPLTEICSATATGILTILTLITREWIEMIFGLDPDNGSGAVEWLIVVALAAATLNFGLLARNELATTSSLSSPVHAQLRDVRLTDPPSAVFDEKLVAWLPDAEITL